MKKRMLIDYHWRCDDLSEIPTAHLEDLEEDAQNHIFQMIREGYWMGDMHTYVCHGQDVVPEEDPEDGLSYSGWWGVKITDRND